MGVSGCLAVVKYLVIFINFIFWLAGLALLGISVWMYIDTTTYLAGEYNEKFFISIYVLMGAGSLMTLIGFLGCCGAMQESSCMLATFSTLVLLVFAAEVGVVVYGYHHRDEIKDAITDRVTKMIKTDYSVQKPVTLAVDEMQSKLKCCGINAPKDWAESTYANTVKEPNTLDSIMGMAYYVPPSCCKVKDMKECKKAFGIATINFVSKDIYNEGCVSAFEKQIESHLYIIVVAGIAITVIQIFGFVFSMVLCCAISSRRY